MREIRALFIFGLFFSLIGIAFGSVQKDVEFEKTAYHLELLRNQLELTVQNNQALTEDIKRQNRDFVGMSVYLRIPTEKTDLKDDASLLASIQDDLTKAFSEKPGIRLKKAAFINTWKVSPRNIPKSIEFGATYQMPEDQTVAHRELALEIEFKNKVPQTVKKNPGSWLKTFDEQIRRLLVTSPKSAWKISENKITGTVSIYRFREFEYPKLVAPDLSRYTAPGTPTTQSQKATLTRIEKYRREIPELWPQAQPYLNDLRQFAKNDVRMSFFLKHASH